LYQESEKGIWPSSSVAFYNTLDIIIAKAILHAEKLPGQKITGPYNTFLTGYYFQPKA
jgi:hypothetical protein